MNSQARNQHRALWQDQLQDAIDSKMPVELRAHLDDCDVCRNEYSRLLTVHARLKNELSAAPPLSENFTERVLARIGEQELTRRAAAKRRAELEFQQRVQAVKLNWREFWQRHTGNIVAALTVVAALVTAMSSIWDSVRERLLATFDALPWAYGPLALPAAMVAAAMLVATLTLWWLRAKAR